MSYLKTLNLTTNQKVYVDLLRDHKKPVVVCTGSAGTGKTYLACMEGLKALDDSKISKLIITRPAQGVDEQYGFLPGDINKKFDPWIQPIVDSVGRREFIRLRDRNMIEISPLAFMRGRTFHDSWIIADEMQNSTKRQMQMILTRLGFESKMVITGDPNQVDINISGLDELLTLTKLRNPEYIGSIEMETIDIKRHPAVKEILEMYLKE